VVPQLRQHGTGRLASWNGHLDQQTAAAGHRDDLHDKYITQHAGSEIASQGKIQRPLYLPAELPGFLLYPSTSIIELMLTLLQGLLKLGIQ
jgi:hypothetical protein